MCITPRSGFRLAVFCAALGGAGSSPAQVLNLHEYFPGLKQGNAWQYTADVRLSPGDAFATFGATLATGTPISIHGVQATPLEMTSTFPGDVGSSRTYSLDPGGLHQHREDFDLTSADFETYPAPVDLAPAQISVGQTYPFVFNYSGQSPADNDTWSGATNGSIQVIGFETINVPAGTFNALRVDFDTAWSETGVVGGVGYAGNGAVDETWWLVNGLGIVRQDTIRTDSYAADDSYVEFSIELTAALVFDPEDLDGDGDVDDADFGLFFAAFSGPGVPTASPAADLDNDGDTDDADFGLAFAAFTGPGNPANVPEPAGAAFLSVAGCALLSRRRRTRPGCLHDGARSFDHL